MYLKNVQKVFLLYIYINCIFTYLKKYIYLHIYHILSYIFGHYSECIQKYIYICCMDEDICYIHNHVSSVFLAQVAAYTQAASKSQLHVVIRKMMFYCPKNELETSFALKWGTQKINKYTCTWILNSVHICLSFHQFYKPKHAKARVCL